METAALFLSSAVAVFVTVLFLSPSRIVSSVLRFLTKQQRVTGSEDYSSSDSDSSNRRRPDQLFQVLDHSSSSSYSSDLPSDIVIDILSRLPVKTLIRFKCVSKHCNQVISNSPYLVSDSVNLIRSQLAPNRIICSYQTRINYMDPYNRDRTVFLSCPDEPVVVDCDRHRFVLCSSGNLGLLLLATPSNRFGYALWNPATRQVRHLPEPAFEPPARPFDLPDHPLLRFDDDFGVGLDLVGNVVKVVLIRKYRFIDINTGRAVSKFTSPVYVYTLTLGGGGGGGWRKLAVDYPYSEESGEHSYYSSPSLGIATHLKGSIYWLSYDTPTRYVVAFDLGTEVFRKVSCCHFDAPPDDDDRPLFLRQLQIYRDSIAIFATKWGDCVSVDVWLLSSSLCWIKDSTGLGPFPRGLFVFGCWKDDLLVAAPEEDEENLVVYDTVKREIKVVIPDVVVGEFFTYKETMVCIQ